MRKALLALFAVVAVYAWVFAPGVLAGDDEVAARLTRQIDALAELLQPGGATLAPAALADSLIAA